MPEWVYIITLIVVMIIIIYIIYWYFTESDEALRSRAKKAIKKSAGIFDNSAREALKLLSRIKEPTADDYFNRGYIVHRNILGGDIDGKNIGLLDVVEAVATNYYNAINNVNTRRVNEFMLHNIEEFIVEEPIFFELNFAMDNYAPAMRQQNREEIVTNAIKTTDNRIDAIEKAFDTATIYTDDRQNVHDSKVNSDLNETLHKLKSTGNGDVTTALNEINDYIAAANIAPEQKLKALRGLETAKLGGFISTFGETEDKILAYTWERCNHKRNIGQENNMRDAVITALVDGIENGAQVCANGRVGRILSSLATLDFDSDVGGALTLEAYMNQIYQETKDIINREIEIGKSSTDPIAQEVANAYETGEDSVNTEAENGFKNNLKREIDFNISRYAAKLSPQELENIRETCYTYATI